MRNWLPAGIAGLAVGLLAGVLAAQNLYDYAGPYPVAVVRAQEQSGWEVYLTTPDGQLAYVRKSRLHVSIDELRDNLNHRPTMPQ